MTCKLRYKRLDKTTSVKVTEKLPEYEDLETEVNTLGLRVSLGLCEALLKESTMQRLRC